MMLNLLRLLCEVLDELMKKVRVSIKRIESDFIFIVSNFRLFSTLERDNKSIETHLMDYSAHESQKASVQMVLANV